MKLPCRNHLLRALPCTEYEPTMSLVLAALGLILSKELNSFFFFSYCFQRGSRSQKEAGDSRALASPCSARSALRAAGMEAVPRTCARTSFFSSLFYQKRWKLVCWLQKHLGIEKCWAWLILCISKQGSYDSEVNWFLLAFTGFVNEYLNTLHQLV